MEGGDVEGDVVADHDPVDHPLQEGLALGVYDGHGDVPALQEVQRGLEDLADLHQPVVADDDRHELGPVGIVVPSDDLVVVELGDDAGEGDDLGVLVELVLHADGDGLHVGGAVHDGDVALQVLRDPPGDAVLGLDLPLIPPEAGEHHPQLVPYTGTAGVLDDGAEDAYEPADGAAGLHVLPFDGDYRRTDLLGKLPEFTAVGHGYDVETCVERELVHEDGLVGLSGVAAGHEEGVLVHPLGKIHGLGDIYGDLGGVVHGIGEYRTTYGGSTHAADHDVLVASPHVGLRLEGLGEIIYKSRDFIIHLVERIGFKPHRQSHHHTRIAITLTLIKSNYTRF